MGTVVHRDTVTNTTDQETDTTNIFLFPVETGSLELRFAPLERVTLMPHHLSWITSLQTLSPSALMQETGSWGFCMQNLSQFQGHTPATLEAEAGGSPEFTSSGLF